jgi:hypothetical protein
MFWQFKTKCGERCNIKSSTIYTGDKKKEKRKKGFLVVLSFHTIEILPVLKAKLPTIKEAVLCEL